MLGVYCLNGKGVFIDRSRELCGILGSFYPCSLFGICMFNAINVFQCKKHPGTIILCHLNLTIKCCLKCISYNTE